MNILFDIGHPAHVHLFRNFIKYLIAEKHEVIVVTRKKDITENLLKHYSIPFYSLSKPKKTKFGMLLELIERDYKILKLHKRYKFDATFGTSVSIGHLTLLKGVPSFNFNEDDDDTVPLFVRISYPFNTKIINPDVIKAGKYIDKRIYHKSYHELAYLHPDNFLPNAEVLKKYSLEPNKYIIIRKSSLSAHHDAGASGLEQDIWCEILELCKGYKLVTSIEGKNSHSIDPWDMHHVLSFAKMLITDGLSMSIEAAVLGTPSLRYNSFEGRSSVLANVDSYGLSRGINADFFGTERSFIEAVKNELCNNDLEKNKVSNLKILREKSDFNRWIIDFFEININLVKKV